MTDNTIVEASKAVDAGRVAAQDVSDSAKVTAHTTLKDAGMKAQNVSDSAKVGVHKAVSDAKNAVSGFGSAFKKS